MTLVPATGRILFFSIDTSPRSFLIYAHIMTKNKPFFVKSGIALHNNALSILTQIGKRVKQKLRKFYYRNFDGIYSEKP